MLEKIIKPEKAEYTIASIVIIIIAVIVKFVFGKYVKKIGKKINSQSLVATGTDAFMDSVLSFSTLVAAIISIIWNISIEGYLGIIISIIIIKSSIEIIKQTIDSIIGERADSEVTNNLKKRINEFDAVEGVYDVTLHNYGPSQIIGSVHIQVDDNMTAKEIHKLTRNIQTAIYSEFGITLTIGIYASNNDENYTVIKKELVKIISQYEDIIQMHGFYVDEENKTISFDIIINFKAEDKEKIKNEVIEKIHEKFPQYNYFVILDTDFSD